VKIAWASLALLALVPSLASAQLLIAPPPGQLPLTPPLSIGGRSYFEELPTNTPNDYAERAQRQNVSGEATVRCTITDDGHLTSCQIIVEDPKGFDLGQAVLTDCKHIKMHATTTDGRPVGGASIDIRMFFGTRTVIGRPVSPPSP